MIGAIVGDIIGSRFEFSFQKAEDHFELITSKSRFTDDSVLTIAVCQALLHSNLADYRDLSRNTRLSLQEYGRLYPFAGYGAHFYEWIDSLGLPYNSYGNGAGMRVSPCAWAASNMDEALFLSDCVTSVTHNHPEGLKGARAITSAIVLARQGRDISSIRKAIQDHYYPLNFTIDGIKETYKPAVSCQETVPQAIEAFLESSSFEDAIRKAISLGGDTDTIAAMTGSIAEAFYGVPKDIRSQALSFLDERMLSVLYQFESTFTKRIPY